MEMISIHSIYLHMLIIKCMTFKEDESHIRRGNGAEVMNTFRKLALNIVRNDSTRKASMKRKLKMAALDDDFIAELLLGES